MVRAIDCTVAACSSTAVAMAVCSSSTAAMASAMRASASPARDGVGLDRLDPGDDVAGRAAGLLREVLDLAGDDREALARLAGPGRLDGGVEREQVGLRCDGGDDLHDVADLGARRAERVDRRRAPPRPPPRWWPPSARRGWRCRRSRGRSRPSPPCRRRRSRRCRRPALAAASCAVPAEVAAVPACRRSATSCSEVAAAPSSCDVRLISRTVPATFSAKRLNARPSAPISSSRLSSTRWVRSPSPSLISVIRAAARRSGGPGGGRPPARRPRPPAGTGRRREDAAAQRVRRRPVTAAPARRRRASRCPGRSARRGGDAQDRRLRRSRPWCGWCRSTALRTSAAPAPRRPACRRRRRQARRRPRRSC